MKKYIVSALMLLAAVTTTHAQSSMTDQAVMEYVIEEHEKGTSQSQIVTQLIQKGVSIDQIRRVKKKYEREVGDKSLGAKNLTTSGKSKDRTRENNGKKKRNDDKEGNVSKYRMKDGRIKPQTTHTFDENDKDYLLMQRELSTFMPDSDEIYDKEYLEMMMMKQDKDKNKRKVFGRDIFNNKDLTFEPAMNIATPKNYRLGPGDAVFIDIYGASQKTIESTVTPEGMVVIEDYGPVSVSGLTVDEANARLRSTLGSRFSSSKVTLSVGQTRTILVNVMGEVKTPGTYTLSAFATVFHALYMAGGISDIGTLRNIKVFRNNRLVSTVDIYDYILNGKLKGNVRLADNDVIVVGPYDCLVNITGKVKRPMFYEMKKSESVGTLLKYAGGFTGDAYKKSVRLVRKAGTQYSVYTVNEFDMNSFRLDDEDSLSVDSILPRYSNMVEVKGAVFRPGMYQVGGDINSVRSLIENAEGVTEDAFTARAVMHRMKPDRTLEVLAVDIAGIMSGRVADIPLRNEDVLYIPSKKELQEEQTLTIHGEVIYPGVYKYADNETIEDLILQAGGLNDAASIMKVDVARRIADAAATTSSDTIAHTFSFAIKDGFVIDGQPGFVLKPYDEVYVRTSPGYFKQQNVNVEGEVLYSGTYTLSKKSQRLSEMIKQAGGVTNTAYVKGARLERKITQDERMKMEDVRKLLLAQSGEKDTLDMKKLDFGETYYVAIDLDKAMEQPGSNYDVILREGDRIIVPEYSSTVKISGDVMSPTTVAYREGKGVNYYIDQAGGWGNRAKKSRTFIVYMNGSKARVGYGVKPLPGCEIIVPSKEASKKMSTAEIVSIGSSTASIATMLITIANLMK
ncbi:MAG: SLBB domain-containing protein [Prevotella sp.]|nr:SLBB domain-containing protein [Prevotella sp.]